METQMSEAERRAWAEVGASPNLVRALDERGGYHAVLDDNQFLLDWQELLDSALQERLVEVRNALRKRGWNAPIHQPLTRAIEGQGEIVEKISHRCRHVGPGANVAGYAFLVDWMGKDQKSLGPSVLLVDEVQETAGEFARRMERQAALFRGRYQTGPEQTAGKPELAGNALRDAGRYGAGFLAALEFTAEGMRQAGMRATTQHEVLEHALGRFDHTGMSKDALEHAERALEEIATEASTALRQGDPEQHISALRQIEEIAERGLYRVVNLSPSTEPSMAERFAQLFEEWEGERSPDKQVDFSAWLQERNLLGEDLNWIGRYDVALDNSSYSYGLLDFGDGSVALRRNCDSEGGPGRGEWMCLRPATPEMDPRPLLQAGEATWVECGEMAVRIYRSPSGDVLADIWPSEEVDIAASLPPDEDPLAHIAATVSDLARRRDARIAGPELAGPSM